MRSNSINIDVGNMSLAQIKQKRDGNQLMLDKELIKQAELQFTIAECESSLAYLKDIDTSSQQSLERLRIIQQSASTAKKLKESEKNLKNLTPIVKHLTAVVQQYNYQIAILEQRDAPLPEVSLYQPDPLETKINQLQILNNQLSTEEEINYLAKILRDDKTLSESGGRIDSLQRNIKKIKEEINILSLTAAASAFVPSTPSYSSSSTSSISSVLSSRRLKRKKTAEKKSSSTPKPSVTKKPKRTTIQDSINVLTLEEVSKQIEEAKENIVKHTQNISKLKKDIPSKTKDIAVAKTHYASIRISLTELDKDVFKNQIKRLKGALKTVEDEIKKSQNTIRTLQRHNKFRIAHRDKLLNESTISSTPSQDTFLKSSSIPEPHSPLDDIFAPIPEQHLLPPITGSEPMSEEKIILESLQNMSSREVFEKKANIYAALNQHKKYVGDLDKNIVNLKQALATSLISLSLSSTDETNHPPFVKNLKETLEGEYKKIEAQNSFVENLTKASKIYETYTNQLMQPHKPLGLDVISSSSSSTGYTSSTSTQTTMDVGSSSSSISSSSAASQQPLSDEDFVKGVFATDDNYARGPGSPSKNGLFSTFDEDDSLSTATPPSNKRGY